jgi:hypothetical protein
VRRAPWDGPTIRNIYHYETLPRGIGFCVTTYSGDGNPLPAFEGEPYPVPLEDDDLDSIAETYWDTLNPDNRVSLAVKFINHDQCTSTHKIINRFSKI